MKTILKIKVKANQGLSLKYINVDNLKISIKENKCREKKPADSYYMYFK